ncbi:MAG TPA: hypothetical protein VL549_01750 [Gemmatimonadales bacterium]|jgi:hypothetical protein|nr:hypothetical protein [Gemmatimonadales bacterium]
MNVRKLAAPLAVLGVVAALMACNTKTTSIKSLLADPGKYDGKVVRIAGTVEQSIGALGYGAYEVQDQTGTIPVVTQGGGAPSRGTRVGVEGTFRAAYTLGVQSRAVLVEKKRVSQ